MTEDGLAQCPGCECLIETNWQGVRTADPECIGGPAGIVIILDGVGAPLTGETWREFWCMPCAVRHEVVPLPDHGNPWRTP